jgi:hypothetical protein
MTTHNNGEFTTHGVSHFPPHLMEGNIAGNGKVALAQTPQLVQTPEENCSQYEILEQCKGRLLKLKTRFEGYQRRYDDLCDKRGVFAFAYKLITEELIKKFDEEMSSDGKHPFFEDPEWLVDLDEAFAQFYFNVLDTFDNQGAISFVNKVVEDATNLEQISKAINSNSTVSAAQTAPIPQSKKEAEEVINPWQTVFETLEAKPINSLSAQSASTSWWAHRWNKVKRFCKNPEPSVLEALIYGILAHIIYDLPYALIESKFTEKRPQERFRDFRRVNDIFDDIADKFPRRAAEEYNSHSLIFLDDAIGGELDEILTNYGFRLTRSMAWYNAIRLSEPDTEGGAVDKSICKSGHKAIKKREMDLREDKNQNSFIVRKAIYNRPNQFFFRIIARLEYLDWLFLILLRLIAWVRLVDQNIKKFFKRLALQTTASSERSGR